MEILDLSEFCKTKAQANDFFIRLSNISQKMYQTDFNLEKELIEQFGIQKKEAFFTLLRNSNTTTTSPVALKAFIATILQKISTLQVLNMTLAFQPNEDTLKALSDWFLLNTNKQVLFNISVDPNLIAGASIYYNSKYWDFSIKPTFDRILREVVTGKPTTPAAATPIAATQAQAQAPIEAPKPATQNVTIAS